MNIREPSWWKESITSNQKLYISAMQRSNPSLPAFEGSTKKDAAEYIERYKKVRPCKQSS